MKKYYLIAMIMTVAVAVAFLFSCKDENEQPNSLKSYLNYDDFVQDGLVAYYSFNGNVDDLSGNDLNGISHNVSYTNDRFQSEEGACHFDGVNSYVSIPNSNLLNSDTYTIFYWYRPNVQDVLLQSIISKSDTSRFGYTIYVINSDSISHLGFSQRDRLGLIESTHAIGLNFNYWYEGYEKEYKCFAIAFSPTKLIDYWGGAERTRSPAIYINDNKFDLYIGFSNDHRFKLFSGDIDELLIYNRILTYDEVEKLSEWKLN